MDSCLRLCADSGIRTTDSELVCTSKDVGFIFVLIWKAKYWALLEIL